MCTPEQCVTDRLLKKQVTLSRTRETLKNFRSCIQEQRVTIRLRMLKKQVTPSRTRETLITVNSCIPEQRVTDLLRRIKKQVTPSRTRETGNVLLSGMLSFCNLLLFSIPKNCNVLFQGVRTNCNVLLYRVCPGTVSCCSRGYMNQQRRVTLTIVLNDLQTVTMFLYR